MPDHFFDPHAVASFLPDKLNKVNLYQSPRLFCDVYCLAPGQQQRLHAHAENDKIYHALVGTCEITIGDETRPLPPGHVAIAPAGVPHAALNASDANATLLVIMAPHPDFP